jgi:hypothetical protein
MSIVTDTWRQLVRRRLWPVAVLLVAALAAVPLLLGKDPEPAPVSAAPAGGAESARLLASEPIVSEATEEPGGKRRRVLGVRHDIFKPTAKAPKQAKADTAGATPAAPAAPAPAAGDGSGGGVPAPESTSPDAPVAPPATEPRKTWPANSLTVRFGDSSADSREKMTLKRLRPLPSALDPVAVYLRLEDDGKTAIFLLAAGVQPTGDGTCRPDKRSCETIALKAGETEFLDVVDADGKITAQYQLDVVAIHNPTASRRGALEARVAVTGAAGLR